MQKTLLLILLFATTLLKAQRVDVVQYRFNIAVNNENDSIQGLTGIDFLNKSGNQEVQFDLASVDPGGRGMVVDAVKDRNENNLPFTHIHDRLTVRLAAALPDSVQQIFIHYRGIPKDGLIIARNKFGDRTYFADNWPNRAHQWIPCNDRPDDKALFSFFVTAPSEYQVISNGKKTNEQELGDGRKRTQWTEDIPLSTKVMAIGVARFATKTYSNRPGPVPVSAWVYPQDSTRGFYDFAVAPEILNFFSAYIAPFPFNKLANVQSTTIFGGMENASCIFYDEKAVTGDRSIEGTIAHEIAHQWFGDMASETSFAHLWLSEGFATYLADLWFEKKYGKEAATERLQDERDEVIEFVQKSNHTVVDSTTDLMSLLNANSYQKGAWVLHMLRNEVGDSVLQAIVQTYYNQYKGSNAETKNFEAVAESVSGKELTWFFDQWLYQPGIPAIRVKTYASKGFLVVTVNQLQPNLKRFPLEIEVIDTAGRHHTFTQQISGATNIFKYPFEGNIKTIRIDPGTKLLFKKA